MVYTDNKDGTITDTITRLMWLPVTPDEKIEWEEAMYYGVRLNLAGHKNWRLPTIKELISIVDCDEMIPECNPIFGAGFGFLLVHEAFDDLTKAVMAKEIK